ncbi:MAG: flavin reductase family protein [Acidobacteriota bacterium]|nr:flavin reductase family protein [Acidobacteriota bacterium]
MSSVPSGLFRRACGKFATGITVITTLDEKGHPHGMTANSFTSLSLAPPLILVAIDYRNAILGHFTTNPYFAVNILSADQRALSERFSSVAVKRFDGIAWRPSANGVPLLEGAVGYLECARERTLETGDHVALVGEVESALVSEGAPLIYFDSAYRELA